MKHTTCVESLAATLRANSTARRAGSSIASPRDVSISTATVNERARSDDAMLFSAELADVGVFVTCEFDVFVTWPVGVVICCVCPRRAGLG